MKIHSQLSFRIILLTNTGYSGTRTVMNQNIIPNNVLINDCTCTTDLFATTDADVKIQLHSSTSDNLPVDHGLLGDRMDTTMLVTWPVAVVKIRPNPPQRVPPRVL